MLGSMITLPHNPAFRHRQRMLLVAVAIGALIELARSAQLHRLPVHSCV